MTDHQLYLGIDVGKTEPSQVLGRFYAGSGSGLRAA